MAIFKHLVGGISIFALNKLCPEWLITWEAYTNNTDLGPCECEPLLAYSLLCRHYLLRACQQGNPIPRSLIHSRWWLEGPISNHNWKPRYREDTEQQLVLFPKRKDIYKAVANLAYRLKKDLASTTRFSGQPGS